MSRLPSAAYSWNGGTLAPGIPWIGDPGSGYVPPVVPEQPGVAGEQFLVAIGGFPTGRRPVVLWDATIEALSVKAFQVGANTCTISFPASQQNLRLVGIPYATETDQAGNPLYTVRDAISWEIIIGSTLDGYARWRFVVRDQVEVSEGRVTVSAVGFVNGVTTDRVIGAPSPVNLLGDDGGSFEAGTLVGWTIHGAGTTAGVEAGGPDGSFVGWVKGTPDRYHYIERRALYKQPPAPYGRQDIAGTALVKLPTGLDIDDYGLVTIAIFDAATGTEIFPGPSTDFRAGIVTSDMVRGSWIANPVVGIGRLPPPPYQVYVCLRLHPVDETQKTYYDAGAIVREESSSTRTVVDLTHHVVKLFDHAQHGRDKSNWGITPETGVPTGIEELGRWNHADGQEMDEALRALAERGMEIFDMAGPGRRVKATKRRGERRTDVIVHDWDVLGHVTIRNDPGAMRTAVRATSAASSIWGGADEGAIDTSQSNGQVIDVVVSGPTGMTAEQLRSWVRNQLAGLSRVPSTTTLLLSWQMGMRLSVGDQVRVAVTSGAVALKDWMQITSWTPDLSGRFVAVDFGTDPELGGN